MLRALLARGAAAATSVTVPLALAAPASSEDTESVMKVVLARSKFNNIKDLKAAGENRRKDEGCTFCQWMVAGPCGGVYIDWDDCVNETKQVEGKNFVEVCRPFTVNLMDCIDKHPDYYEELTKREASKQKDAPPVDSRAEWEWKSEVDKRLVKGPVLSMAQPAAWAGKEGKHVPVVAQGGGRVTVVVPHDMAADHFIEFVWARCDATGKILKVVKLAPTDKPEITFEVPAGVVSITAFESCNL